MKISKIKIIIICGILVLSAASGLLIRLFLINFNSKSEKAPRPNLSVEFPKALSPSDRPSTFKKSAIGFQPGIKGPENLNFPALPTLKPSRDVVSKEKYSPSSVTPFFENINKAAQTAEKSLMPDSVPVQNISTVTPAGVILSLTKDQFRFLYPDDFIADLIDAQNSFIRGYDPNYESIPGIETDSQVRSVEEKIVATLLSADMITKEKADQFVTTIRFTLPRLQIIDLKRRGSYGLRESSRFSKFLNSALENAGTSQTAPKRLFFADLMKELANILVNKAQAVCGSCSSLPECFQVGAAVPGVAGSELFYPSCYCTGCLTSLGCLSANSGQAAIYDQTTGICGTGLSSESQAAGSEQGR